MDSRPNKVFYAVATAASLAAFTVFVLAAGAVARYRKRRAWRKVTAL